MDTSLHWPVVLRPPANLKGASSQAHLLVMSLKKQYNGHPLLKFKTNMSTFQRLSSFLVYVPLILFVCLDPRSRLQSVFAFFLKQMIQLKAG